MSASATDSSATVAFSLIFGLNFLLGAKIFSITPTHGFLVSTPPTSSTTVL